MSDLIRGIHHISLKCRDTAEWEKVLHFYRDVLRLRVVRCAGEGAGAMAMLDTGCGLIEVFANGHDAPGQGVVRRFALAVCDADACAAAVQAAGYPVFVEPKDIVLGGQPPLAARIAFCKGPLGEDIEFFQEK